jgi:hypothetical protein
LEALVTMVKTVRGGSTYLETRKVTLAERQME